MTDLQPADDAAASERAAALEELEDGAPPSSLWSDAWRELRGRPLFWICATIVFVLLVAAVFPGWFTSSDPRAGDLNRSMLRPSSDYWWGTTFQGYDMYARVIYGARASVAIGLLVTGGTALIALVLGSIAGYYGGIVDTIIARITDIWFAVPLLLGAIVLLTVLDGLADRSIWTVSLALIIFGWPTMLRLVRSSVLALRDADFVDAARALGASNSRIITRHILPNALTPLIVFSTITIGVVIAAEATLSFLGVGLQLPAISWGLMTVSYTHLTLPTTPYV